MSEHTNATLDEVHDAGPADMVDDDLPSLLQRREHARPNRLTWVLLGLLLVSVGFAGGAYVDQRFGASTGGLPAGFPAGLPASGMPEQGAVPSFGDMTVGTVKLVDKQSLYVTTPDGETVKVTVPDTVSVTTQQDVDLADLAAGSTVLIRGTTDADGTVTATSVSEGSLPGAPTTTTAPTTQGEN